MTRRSSVAVEKQPTGMTWRRERARQMLMTAAAALFARQGVDATTIDEIVDKAGVAKGTFYNHFADRNEIARALADQMRSDIRNAVSEFNAGIADPALRVHRGVQLFIVLAERNEIRARLLLRLYDGVVDPTRHGNERLMDDLAAGVRSGRFRVPSAEAALHLVLGLAMAAMRHVLDSGPRESQANEAYRRKIAALLLQGLGLRAAEIAPILRHSFDPPRLALLDITP